ncbi:DUF4139 domain-containing protein [Elioraea tepidiphila]|uniref:DUF4139 domain-containing protein n=1 Tax=Elioraea tepidiphila TaxID=457934 RepID=UPI0003762775|nr:DUF4139 domain-containing protein [Elioraea tepidiphila]
MTGSRRHRLALACALALGTTFAMATELPVVSVTLSNAGLAQIERRGTVGPDAPVVLRAPTADVDDLLKSLVVLDPVGTVEGIRPPARDASAEAFRGLPLRPEDFASRVALLRALRGQRVEAGGVTGRLADAEETEAGLRVVILTETGVAAALIREGDEVRLTDTALAARVRRAADALGAARTEDERRIEIGLRADRAREVGVLSVTGAPLWKPSWRLLVPEAQGEARLVGWAVIENRSGADWSRVRLALVSGNPAAYRQALYTPIEVPRVEIPVRAAETVTVRPDTGPRPPPPPAPVAASGPARMRAAMESAAAPAAPSMDQAAAQPQAAAESSIGRVAFTLPAPVTVLSGETANVPFLDARLPAERVWWVQDLRAGSPLLAVRVTNATGSTLPDGIVTVFGAEGAETGAFLGDSELRAIAPDEQRLLAFGRDRDVRITHAQSATDRPHAVAVQRGRVILRGIQRVEEALAIDPRGARGRLIVDVPRRPGTQPDFAVASEGEFGLRHEMMLTGTTTTLRLGFEREMRAELRLWDQGLRPFETLGSWREVEIEALLPRLPGGPGTLERLRELLARLPADAEGRAALQSVIDAMADLRVKLDAARTAARSYAVANAALTRARQAVEDRTGPQREAARRQLNEASLAVERAGEQADAAWEAWREAVQALLARES